MAEAVVLFYFGVAVLAVKFGLFIHESQEPDAAQPAQQDDAPHDEPLPALAEPESFAAPFGCEARLLDAESFT
jgi:hypothetical protein